MEFDELLITTGVDALVRLVKEKGTVELDIASKTLKIPSETIEDWAHILEEQGIIRINYRLTKVHLSWIQPTAEQIEKERESFYEEKREVGAEVEAVRRRISPQLAELEDLKKSFSEIYDKLYPKLSALESDISSISKGPIPKADSAKKIAALSVKIDAVEKSASSLTEDLEFIKGKLSKEEKPKTPKELEQLRTDIASFEKQLKDFDQRFGKVSKSIPSELPSSSEIKKKLESMKKEFAEIRSSNAKLREDLIGVKESSDIVSAVAESAAKYDSVIKETKEELKAISLELDKIIKRTQQLADEVKSDMEAVGRFSDSIEVAKGILKRFPSQDKVMKQLDDASAREKEIAASLEAIERLVSGISVPKNLLDEMASTKRALDDKHALLLQEANTVFKAMEDETATYATFQKIKEKAIVSLEAYATQLEALEEEISSLRKQLAGIDVEAAAALSQKLKGTDLEGIVSKAADLKGKKQLLDEIRLSLDTLSDSAEGLNKRLVLLSKEAELLELRAGGVPVPPGKTEEKEEAIRNQISLTSTEEAEFQKKREELRELIKKLWEQS